MEPCGLPGLLVFVGGNLERTWNELRRECFCEGTKMVGETAGNEKIYDAMWGTKIVHTAVHTIVHTGVHTQQGSPCFLGVFTNVYERKI